MSNGETTVRITKETHARLQSLGGKGETFESIVAGLLDRSRPRKVVNSGGRDFHRKRILRQELTAKVGSVDTVYAPFIGDGRLVYDLYRERHLYGTEADWKLVNEARALIPYAVIEEGRAEAFDLMDEGPFDVADFDARMNPYPAFKAFWNDSKKADTMLLVFSDGLRGGIIQSGNLIRPSGTKKRIADHVERATIYGLYFEKVIVPWFTKFIKPYEVVDKLVYMQGTMCYWGAVIEKAETLGGDSE